MAKARKSNWFQRISEGIRTHPQEKKEMPEGLWFQCPSCKERIPFSEHKDNLLVCSSCNYHDRMSPTEYFNCLFNTNRYKIHFQNLYSKDPLEFVDTKPYTERIKQATQKSNAKEAIEVASGKMGDHRVVIACMNFKFIGGSMGSVVGEKIARAVDFCLENKLPLIIINKSGGARMQEAGLSLMQMIKTTAKLKQLADAKLPYISVLTDPTTGGVTASFAMLGDVNIAEPNALIGFAGPRVIRETIGKKKELPEDFQRSESLLEHGFLDFIVQRSELRDKIIKMLSLLK